MPYVNDEQIALAREVDLLNYLQIYEPDNLVYCGAGQYCTKEHDSLKISNGKFHWWSRGIGGKGALDYLVKVKNYTFPDAVALLIGEKLPEHPNDTTRQFSAIKPREKKPFVMPERHSDNRRVFAYLRKRGIDPEIINHCIKHGYLYEQNERHNAVFVGRDKDGNEGYAALRGTLSGSVFVGEAPGSEKSIGFSMQYSGDTLHVYESAIDLLSFLSLRKLAGTNWRSNHHLSLGSVHKTNNSYKNGKLPPALERYIEDFPEIRTIVLLLDGDEAGRNAADTISALLPDKLIINRFPTGVKDINELLQQTLKIEGSVKMRGNKNKGGDAR